MSDYATLLVTTDGPITTITLNRPKALNALNSQLLGELNDAIAAVEADASARALILTGAGKAFVAGADISEMVDFTEDQALVFALKGQRILARLEALPIPVIAAVNGYALGGGCELAMACDIIYASEKARFGQPEVNLGVIPGFGGTQRLTRLVGPMIAQELIYSGRIIKPDEALRVGLVARVTPPEGLLEAAQATANTIATKGPVAIAHAKAVIRDGAGMPLPQANDLEAKAFAACFLTEDQSEGMAAFLEKREAAFKGS